MIPTTPWEAVFRGIGLWLGIDDTRMDEVCPNIQNFNSSYMIDYDEIYGEILVPAMPSLVPSSPPSLTPSTSSVPSYFPSNVPSTLPSEVPSPAIPSVSPFSTPSQAPIKSTTVPTTSPINCIDRTDQWTIGDRTRNWCTWAANGADPLNRCRKKDLYMDCPVTCGDCVTTPAPSTSPNTTPTNCIDRTDQWTIGDRTRNWCTWAANGADPLVRCRKKDLYTDCPVTCDSCPTPAPVPTNPTVSPVEVASPSCEDRTDKWALVDGGAFTNWCYWAANGADPLVRCRKKDLYTDCPVTCDRCTS